jgi:hypothetical protein
MESHSIHALVDKMHSLDQSEMLRIRLFSAPFSLELDLLKQSRWRI